MRRGGEGVGYEKKPRWEGVWIFSGTMHALHLTYSVKNNCFLLLFSYSGMPLTDKSKPSITKWLEKSERSICSYTQAGAQEIIMRNKGKRRREKEINLKVYI